MDKVKLKKTVKCIVYFLVTILIYLYLCMIFTPKRMSDMGAKGYYVGQGFLSEPVNNSVDVLFIGNSDVYSGVSPIEVYKKHGITSFSSGAAWQTISNINVLVDKAIDKQKPKILVLDVDCLYSKSGRSVSDITFLGSPFIYHTRWKEICKRDFLSIPRKEKMYDHNKGYIYSEKVKVVKNKGFMGNKNAKPKSIKKKNYKELKKLIDKCKENNIELLFIEIPSSHSWNYAKHNYIDSIAKQNNIEFIDMNIPSKEFEVDYKRDYRDNGDHMNIYGAKKVSKYLGDYLNENYSDILKDRRGDNDLNYWNKAVTRYIKKYDDKTDKKDNLNKIRIDIPR